MSARLYVPLTVIVLGGAFLRTFQLTEIPPGLHYDIAANALLTNGIAFDGWRPTFISAYTGKEVLFFYWAAVLFRLVGSSVFTLRLAAALLGVLAIPAAFFAVREVCRRDPHSVWLALFSATFLAFSFMHLVWSRFGLRVIAEPLTQALALGFLFRGLRRGQYVDFAGAGLFTGLTAHTYLAARVFPLPIAVSLLILLGASRRSLARGRIDVEGLRARMRQLGLFVLVAFVVFAPLGAFFLQHPESFLVRVSQVAPREGEGHLLWRGVSGAVGMLFIAGEPYDRFNIPGKPILDPILGTLFVVGLFGTLRGLVRPTRPQTPVGWAAEALLLAWVPVFLLPTALAVHDIFPSNVRAFGLIPLLFVFPARGLLVVAGWVAARRPSPVRWLSKALGLTWALAALVGFMWTGYDYFKVWAHQESQHLANDGDLTSAAAYLNAFDLATTNAYMSAIHYRHPTLAYLAQQYDRLRWFTGGMALALPDGPALYLFPQSAPPPADWTAGWGAALVAAPADPNGTLDFRAFRFSSAAAAPLPEFTPTQANFGYLVELTGYRLVAARAGEDVIVDLRLHVLNPPDAGDYRIVADLVDAWGHHWAQGFNDSYPSEQWQVGDTILTRLSIPVAAGTPPGEYSFAVTLYSPSSATNIPALDEVGRSAAAAAVGPIQLLRADDFAAQPDPQHRLAADFGPLTLFGYDLNSLSLRPGEVLPLTLYWLARDAPRSDFDVLLDLDSTRVEAGAPVHDTYQTTRWTAGEIVIDRHQVRLPRELAPGEYAVDLALRDAAGQLAGSIDLGAVKVTAVERQFEPPAPAYPAAATLGGHYELVGYDLEAREGLSINLYWRSRAESDLDFTVFVHVRDESGQLVAQQDNWPRNGTYPTSLWLSGEYVVDPYHFSLSSGRYSLAIGLYRPETGERLQRSDGDDFVLIEDVVVP